ncbi:ribosomal large subunit 23S rRNA methyltransferase [Neoasaia chiangmaiensis NBRC 101099]|uniref:tRNA (Uracil-5-)-methyltransferase n=1 Tax=Neoasaia chiangmaiensis TaxID=320497 RepID=A0A1U9KMU7_9PROT|nr:TRAM domain-containing protein [Neoasaia chiangmaiensis]AQS87078.1 tRNA (uracil-5-)-methyltransferase [Neoasaia chiangmaiensis]GBR37994.1 ribosomal large subunit 23S rRNA methyltransferase [Neoasaia chiangmaiensis NBRC 101099]GEN15222.1 RNA methyltransferase [Neoasaia chiangmaiensis]
MFELSIVALGADGDGLGHHQNETIFVPGALPGEIVEVERQSPRAAALRSILHASPARVVPPCPLFGACGGCTLQMLRLDALLDWKADRVQQALSEAGFIVVPEPVLFQTAERTRRRLDLGIQRVPNGMVIGLHQRHGPPVDMTTCHVASPEIVALLEPLRLVFSTLGALTGVGDLQINLLATGPDLLLRTANEPTASDRAKLADFARKHSIPRISWASSARSPQRETLAQIAPVNQIFGPLTVSPPTGAFLQATPEGENAIVQAVLRGLPTLNKRDIIIELYAGCGTLTGPLSQKGKVQAYEGDTAAATALRKAQAGHRIDTFNRDLVRQPLSAQEIAKARVVVLDPPYSGAGPQLDAIAASDIADIIYVSCNPKALVKDARSLNKAGYEILDLTVIDQFLWSSEVETVVTFSKDRKRLRKRYPAAA